MSHRYTQHGGKLSSRQILVMTTTDKPFSDKPGDQKLREVVLQRAADAKEERIEINVLPLCQDGQVFDVGAFYSDIISAPAPSPLVLSTDDDPRTEDVHLAQFKSKVLCDAQQSCAHSVGPLTIRRPHRCCDDGRRWWSRSPSSTMAHGLGFESTRFARARQSRRRFQCWRRTSCPSAQR